MGQTRREVPWRRGCHRCEGIVADAVLSSACFIHTFIFFFPFLCFLLLFPQLIVLVVFVVLVLVLVFVVVFVLFLFSLSSSSLLPVLCYLAITFIIHFMLYSLKLSCMTTFLIVLVVIIVITIVIAIIRFFHCTARWTPQPMSLRSSRLLDSPLSSFSRRVPIRL